MKMKYKVLLIFAIALTTCAIGYSQSPTQGEPSQELREVAKEEVDVWIEELSLTGKQAVLMEKKIIEFAMKRDEILQSKMREEAKTKRLKALQILEYQDMRDILTKPQYERYLAIKQERIDQQKKRTRR